jgi:hypothetical protein
MSHPESDAVREIRRLRAFPGNCAEANALLDEAIRVQIAAERGDTAPKRSRTPEWLSQALNEGDGVYRP